MHWQYNNDNTFTISMSCDMLVDQRRYIGNDPVGHKCTMSAVWEDPDTGYLFCARCMDLYAFERHRLTFPPIGGRAYQEQAIKSIAARFTPTK
jgi:hypothetical protein